MPRLILLLFLLTLPQHNVMAQSSSYPEQWDSDLTQVLQHNHLEKVGSSIFTFLFWDLYESQLFTTSGHYPVQAPDEKLLYEINYFKAISAKDLVEKSVEQWQHLQVPASRYEPYLAKLERIWPDIQPGDKLTMVMSQQNSAFYYNQRLVGVIGSDTFGPLFLDIWLSENTSQPDLRASLLGRN